MPRATRSSTATKRKNDGDDVQARPPIRKKPRRVRGSLSELPSLPLDVLGEIYGHLEPLDLLHLTWTSKDIRHALMTKNSWSSAIWRKALSNIPGLPACPEDLTPAQYTSLAFWAGCHVCGHNTETDVYWYARVRVCQKCIIKCVGDVKPNYSPKELRHYLPICNEPHLSYRPGQRMYYSPTCLKWSKEYLRAKDKSKWINDKLDLQNKARTHADECRKWSKSWEATNKEIVMQRWKKLDWENELKLMSYNQEKPQNHQIVIKACQKVLTEKALLSLDTFFNNFMTKVKNERLAQDRRRLLIPRLEVFKDAYNKILGTLPVNAIHPPKADVFLHPSMQINFNLPASVQVNADHFKNLKSLYDQISAEWRDKVGQELFEKITGSSRDVHHRSPTTLFDLATTSFLCKGQHKERTDKSPHFFRYPDILMHECPRTTYNRSKYHLEGDLLVVKEQLYSIPWNANKIIQVDTLGSKAIEKAVKLCGLNPKTATAADMDRLNPIFECLGCNTSMGRAVMTWRHVAAHIHDETKEEHDVKLVDEQDDLRKAREHIQEDIERQRYTMSKMICNQCRKEENWTRLVEHVQKKHHVLVPTLERDIILPVGTYHREGFTRLWPPRDFIPFNTSLPPTL